MKRYPGKYDFAREPSRRRMFVYSTLMVVIFFASLELMLRVFEFGFYVNFNADLIGMPLVDMTRFRRVTNRTVDFDPYLFWKFKPNQVLEAQGIYRRKVIINDRGFRGLEFTENKPKGVFRIICLGDSSTFGWSVGEDETYPSHLERILADRYPSGVFEVLNLGVTGYSSRQGRELLFREARYYEPDMVIFAFGPNDRLPALKSDAEHLRDRTWSMGKAQVLLNRIQIYKLIKSGVIYIENRMRGISLDPATFIPLLKRKVSQDEFAENAAKAKSLCDDMGAGFILVNVDYPSEPMDHVTQLLEDEAAEAGIEIPQDWEFWNSTALVEEISQKLSVPALDIRLLFRNYLELMDARKEDREPMTSEDASKERVEDQERWSYLMVDNGHPSDRGNELIANALMLKLESDPRFIEYIENTTVK